MRNWKWHLLLDRQFLKRMMLTVFISHFSLVVPHFPFLISHFEVSAQSLTLVELNCENLFDCRHDSLKQDTEWLPASVRKWTHRRYWRKVNNLGQELLSCQDEGLPDLVCLVEVENDSVMRDLTRRSLLRNAGYDYLMTESPDLRGIDVALLYQPMTFRPLCYESIEVTPAEGMRPTRDILYVMGETFFRRPTAAAGDAMRETLQRDTLHVFVVHAPSRYGGERATRPNRRIVAERIVEAVSLLPAGAKILVAGDFNDYADSPALLFLAEYGLHNITAGAVGTHGAEGTYRYQGRWESIDHVLASRPLQVLVKDVRINDAPFLIEPDKKYGGVKPLRTFNGYRYRRDGFSDHLPLVVRFGR